MHPVIMSNDEWVAADQRAWVALMTSRVPWPKEDSRYALHGGCSAQQ